MGVCRAYNPTDSWDRRWMVSTATQVGIDSPEGLALHLRPTVLKENPHSPAAMGITSPDCAQPEAPPWSISRLWSCWPISTTPSRAYTAASFQSLMFCTSTGSVRDFYRDTSFNNLDIVPAEETCGTANDGITDWTDAGLRPPNYGWEHSTIAITDIVKNVLVANNSCIDFASFRYQHATATSTTSELTIVVVVAGCETAYSTAVTHPIVGPTKAG